MDAFFQKLTSPAIKTEDFSEIVDINPKNTVQQWDQEMTKKFAKHTFFTSDKEFDTFMRNYVLSLKNRAINLKDKSLLREKILTHLKILHLCFQEREHYVTDAMYYLHMEEILTVYCNLEMVLAQHLRRNEMPTKEYNIQINMISRRICKFLSIFLEHKKHIIHVLLKLTFRAGIHAHQYIMRLLFMHFLMKSPLESLSDEAFCRYYLAFERYKEVSTEDCRSKMDDALFIRFQRKPDFLKTSDIMKKVLRPTNFSITGIINHLIDYRSVTVQAYFDYIKNKNCEELPDIANILTFHDNEEHNKDENNFGRVYDDVIKSFTNKPSCPEIKEEECIDLDSDSDVAVTSEGLIQLILGDSDDEISEIAFMETSINNKHKSRKKKKHHDAYPIVSYIDLDSDIPTTSCQDLTQTSTSTITTASTSIQSLPLPSQSAMNVSTSEQTSPPKQSNTSVCESISCENVNGCSKCSSKNQVEEHQQKPLTLKTVEIQTDPIISNSNQSKEGNSNTEVNDVLNNQQSEGTTRTNMKSVGVDPINQHENEISKENHHLHENVVTSTPTQIKEVMNEKNNLNKLYVGVMDPEVECTDEKNKISDVVQIDKEISTNVEYLKQNETISQSLIKEKIELNFQELPQMSNSSVSTSSELLSLNSQSVKTIGKPQQTSENENNNNENENNNNGSKENSITITSKTSLFKAHVWNEEERLNFDVLKTQSVALSDQLEEIEAISNERSDTLTSPNLIGNTKDNCADSVQQHKEENKEKNCRRKNSLIKEHDDQTTETGHSITCNVRVQYIDHILKKKSESSIMVKSEDDFLDEQNTDSPSTHNYIAGTVTCIKVQGDSEKEGVLDAHEDDDDISFVDTICNDTSSSEMEFIKTNPNMQSINKLSNISCNLFNKKDDVFCNQNGPLEAYCKSNVNDINYNLQNNQQETSDSLQSLQSNLYCSKQNSIQITKKENLVDINSNDNDVANFGANTVQFSGSYDNLSHKEEFSNTHPITQDRTVNVVSENEELKKIPMVEDQENITTSRSVQSVSTDNSLVSNKMLKKNSSGNLCDVNSNGLKNKKIKIQQHLRSPLGKNHSNNKYSVVTSLSNLKKISNGHFKHMNDLIEKSEKLLATVNHEIYMEKPQLSENISESHRNNFEKETVIQPTILEENQVHLNYKIIKVNGYSLANETPIGTNINDVKDNNNTQHNITASTVNGKEFSSKVKFPNTENINSYIEDKANTFLVKNIIHEEKNRLPQKRKFDELIHNERNNDRVEKKGNVHAITSKHEIMEEFDQVVNTIENGEFEDAHKLNKNSLYYNDTNNRKLNSQTIYNNVNNKNRSLNNSQKKLDSRHKRNKTKRSLKASGSTSSIDENKESVERNAFCDILKIQQSIIVESNTSIETTSSENSTEDLEQSFTAEEPIVQICNYLTQNPATEAITTKSISKVTETTKNHEINSTENPKQFYNTEESSVVQQQNTDKTDCNATNTLTTSKQCIRDVNELLTETEVPLKAPAAVGNVINDSRKGKGVSEKENYNNHDTSTVQETEKSANKSSHTKHNQNKHNGDKKNKRNKSVYTCESVKDIPLEEFHKMEKKFSHLLNSSERDEFEDVFSGPVTNLNKNSSNSLYYDNSNGFKFDLFSFAKSQPLLPSNSDEKDFSRENKGNSPASSRSGSPTISPEYEMFDWNDFGNYIEQSHIEKKNKNISKHKVKPQEIRPVKPKTVKRCKFSDTVKTRIIDSDSEYNDLLVPMDSLKTLHFDHACENILWNGVKCFMDPKDAKVLLETSVELKRISDNELAYRIYRTNTEKTVYPEIEPYKKPRHNTSRSCIQQKLDFKKDNNKHSEAYAQLGVGKFVSSNYPAEDYTPLGVGGLNSSNYVPTTRISDKGMVDITNLIPINNESEFHSENISVSAQPNDDNDKIPINNESEFHSENISVSAQPNNDDDKIPINNESAFYNEDISISAQPNNDDDKILINNESEFHNENISVTAQFNSEFYNENISISAQPNNDNDKTPINNESEFHSKNISVTVQPNNDDDKISIINEYEFHSENISDNNSDKIICPDDQNLSVPFKEKTPELHSEFSNSPKFLPNSEQLVQECVAKTFEEVPEIIGSQSDILLLSDHSNFYLEAGNEQILNLLPSNLIFTQDLVASNFDPNEQEEIDVVGVSQSDSANCGADNIDCNVDDTDISDLMIFKNTTSNIEHMPQETQIDNNELMPNVDSKNKEHVAESNGANDLPKPGANYSAEDLYNYVLNDKVHIASIPLDDFKTTNSNCAINLDCSNNSHSVNQFPQCMADNFNYLSDNLHTCSIYNPQLLEQSGLIYTHASPENTFGMPIITKENQALLNTVNTSNSVNQTHSTSLDKTLNLDITNIGFKPESKTGSAKRTRSPKAKACATEIKPGKVKRGRPRLGTRKRSTSKTYAEDCNIYLNEKYNKRASPVKNLESCYSAFTAHNALNNPMNLNLFKPQTETSANNYNKDYMSDITKAYTPHERIMGNQSQKLFSHNENYNKSYSFNAAKTYLQEHTVNNYNTTKIAIENAFYPHSHKLGNYLNSCTTNHADKLPYFGSYESNNNYNISSNNAEKCYKDGIDITRTLNQHTNFRSLNSHSDVKANDHEQNSGDIDKNLLSSVTEVSNTNKEYIKLLSSFMPRETLNYEALAYANSNESSNPFYDLTKYSRTATITSAKQYDATRIDMSSNNCKPYVTELTKAYFPNQAIDLQKSYVTPPSSVVPGRPINADFESMNLTTQKHTNESSIYFITQKHTSDLANCSNLNMGMYAQPPNPLTDTTMNQQYSKSTTDKMKNVMTEVNHNLYETSKPLPVNTHSNVKYLNELHALHTRKAGEKLVPKVPRKRKCGKNEDNAKNEFKENTDSIEKEKCVEALNYSNTKDNTVATSELSPNSSSIEDDHEFNEEEINAFLRLLNNGSETSLPFKKRRRSVKQDLNNYMAPEEEISYPATPMISIAEIEALKNKTTVRPFKTPAERKEMPPLPVDTTNSTAIVPVLSEQININNHTYINPIINCHMHATAYFHIPVYHEMFLKVNLQNSNGNNSMEFERLKLETIAKE